MKIFLKQIKGVTIPPAKIAKLCLTDIPMAKFREGLFALHFGVEITEELDNALEYEDVVWLTIAVFAKATLHIIPKPKEGDDPWY